MSRLAHQFTTILPVMTVAEAIETTRIHRVTGLTGVPRPGARCLSRAPQPSHLRGPSGGSGS